ncbi:hypothetical protein CY34DRAFT_803682 [Suillus luteus UH-Slu-Lm8-n1]|uniref:Uncharacterized protein n=1 Tax=Suillus luteus UH-Slu-Lm8-n1 TaxID=930992 RepID=A0A0D0B0Q1_9AGAM|nr:hypothetical protein CY34DRAFT_803682 [Suillus luteus UH-Slu-Lm8-n1]
MVYPAQYAIETRTTVGTNMAILLETVPKHSHHETHGSNYGWQEGSNGSSSTKEPELMHPNYITPCKWSRQAASTCPVICLNVPGLRHIALLITFPTYPPVHRRGSRRFDDTVIGRNVLEKQN